jgi:hypothetical protein
LKNSMYFFISSFLFIMYSKNLGFLRI